MYSEDTKLFHAIIPALIFSTQYKHQQTAISTVHRTKVEIVSTMLNSPYSSPLTVWTAFNRTQKVRTSSEISFMWPRFTQAYKILKWSPKQSHIPWVAGYKDLVRLWSCEKVVESCTAQVLCENCQVRFMLSSLPERIRGENQFDHLVTVLVLSWCLHATKSLVGHENTQRWMLHWHKGN